MKTSIKNQAIACASLLLMTIAGNAFAQTGMIGTTEGDKTTLEQNVFGLGTNFSLMSAFMIALVHRPINSF